MYTHDSLSLQYKINKMIVIAGAYKDGLVMPETARERLYHSFHAKDWQS